MRRTNWRFVITGLILVIAACAFFLGATSFAGRSNDPVAMMQTVGTVSGIGGALGVVFALLGLLGKRF